MLAAPTTTATTNAMTPPSLPYFAQRSLPVMIEGDVVRADLVLDTATAFDVHEFVCEHPFTHRTICAPDVYGWRAPCDSARHEWTRAALPELPCETAYERLLVAAIRQFHESPVANLAETYVQAGGRLTLAPAVVGRLRAQGMTGLVREHFEAPLSLPSLARRLRPLDG